MRLYELQGRLYSSRATRQHHQHIFEQHQSTLHSSPSVPSSSVGALSGVSLRIADLKRRRNLLQRQIRHTQTQISLIRSETHSTTTQYVASGRTALDQSLSLLHEHRLVLRDRDHWLQLKRDLLRRSLALLKIRRNELINQLFTFYPLQMVLE